MKLPDLFVEKEQSLEKEASYRLGSDLSTWEQDIVERLHEEHPYLPDYDISVSLRKTDGASGAGIGQLTIDDDIRLPVIIKAFKMQPLDLMYYDGKLLPVTKESLDNITHSDSLGKGIRPHPQGSDMGIRAATRAPHYGKYAYASTLDFTSVDLAGVLDSAYASPATMSYDIQDSRYLREGVAQYVQHAGVEKVASEARINYSFNVSREWEDVSEGFVHTPQGSGVLCKIATVDGKLNDKKMFVGFDGAYGFVDSVAGFPLTKEASVPDMPVKGEGVFVAQIGDEFVTTEPLRVMFKTAEYTAVRTAMGQELTVHQDKEFSGWKKIAQDLYISDAWKFVPIKARTGFNTALGLNKVAKAKGAIQLHKSEGMYSVRGEVQNTAFEKLANRFYSEEDLRRELAEDLTADEMASMLKTAEAPVPVVIVCEHPIQEKGIVFNSLDEATLQNFVKSAAQITERVVKEAGVDEDDAEQTVDKLLGLNFINDQNILRIVETVDDLEVARGVLSRILLAGRMGLDVDVNVVRSALFALDGVIKDLRGLRHTHPAT